MLLDNIEIKGTLASDWMKREKVELRTSKPIGGPESDVVDEETQALIAKHKSGSSSKATRELLGMLKDPEAGKATHAAIVEALSTGPKKAAHNVVDLLYSTALPVREYGAEIIKALVGDDFGYKPKGKEKSRSEAIRKLLKELSSNPDFAT